MLRAPPGPHAGGVEGPAEKRAGMGRAQVHQRAKGITRAKSEGGTGTILLPSSFVLALSVCYLRFSSVLQVGFSKCVFR